MKKLISPLTNKILSYASIEQINTDDSIDWAIEMMELGYECPSLAVLASFSKPTNYFEIIEYIKEAVQELGLEMKTGNDAILSYTSYYVYQIADKQHIRKSLAELYQFCTKHDYEDIIYDFYLLYWAWDQLDYDENKYNHYWEGATRDNIEQIVVNTAKKWIKENEKTDSRI